MKQGLLERMAGEVAVSDHPGRTLRKWRLTFGISQPDLAAAVGVSPSVIADYEAGRRSSPRVGTIKKLAEALLGLDARRGSVITRLYSPKESLDAILSMKELPSGVRAGKLMGAVGARVVAHSGGARRTLYGYTVLDSLKAILTLSAQDYLRVFGRSSERALVFTGVKYGRSPMVAVRSHPMKPALVILHKPERVDRLSLALAEVEKIPLAVTTMDLGRMLGALERLRG